MSSEHLTSVVNDVLDFAKIESGQMRISRDVQSARASIDSAISMLQARASEKKIRVTVSSAIEAVFLGDAQRVQQILLNLLSNALKFTPERGSVVITCEHRESRGFGEHVGADSRTAWTCISVRDDGIGIAADQIGPIFEPFVQGAGGYTRPHGGSGLGLAISRSLARMMDGDITVESEPGAGSTFTLWLPHPSTAAAATS
ncbi:MAG TPA: ATP-binding protein [Longimicrobiales bacterium]|nr:ATP-binding protein [Longimicrobiales bacterium]